MSDQNNNLSKSEVQEFYKHGKVLVTGATGFVGKALVEKLLRSCPELSTVFVLIRTKRGLDPATRLGELLSSTVFDRLKAEENGKELLSKVKVVLGDVTEPALGLSPTDQDRLQKEVTVVFHSAASIRFDDTLKNAVKLNLEATQTVLEFCKLIQNLKALVHISTAYSNADKASIDEIIYKPPINPSTLIDLCYKLDDKTIEEFSSILLRYAKQPNTYTLTKSMAEWIVREHSETFPAAIVRPSIVTGAWREPVPGWVDNISGITGIMMEIGRGTVRSVLGDGRKVVDIIPVDIVVNTLITAACHINHHRSNGVRIYNCTSGSLNTIYWHELGTLTVKHSITVPSKYIQWYPGFSYRTNHFSHSFVYLFLHYLPAVAGDLILRLQGTKPFMLRVCEKIKNANKNGEFFSLHEWDFKIGNQKSLTYYLNDADVTIFPPDVTLVNWDDYMGDSMAGIRKYVLKDSMDSLPAAKNKLQRFYILHRCGQALVGFMLLKLILR